MNMSNSSLLATWRYSDMVPQPSRSASLAIDSAARPSASTNSIAQATMRSRLSPRARRVGGAARHRISSARGSGLSVVITHQPNRYTRAKRMTYAFAYDIRITRSKPEMARSRPRRCRRRVPRLLATAVLHGWHPGARDIRSSLPAAGRPRDVRKRRDGDGGGADLAGTARQETRPA